MASKKPKVVIIGAGMAGLTAANKLYTAAGSKGLLDISVVEGGNRIGGRINTSVFGGDRIEMGATWIHGIGGSPVYRIAEKIGALASEQPWECMDSSPEEPITIAEGGYEISPTVLDTIANLFKRLMDFAQGSGDGDVDGFCPNSQFPSIGGFLRKGLQDYWDSIGAIEEIEGVGNWGRRQLEEAIFAMFENTQRTYTSAGDLETLDFEAESEYRMFPGDEITIAKGYLSIIESLASVLPPGLIQLGRNVSKIEWNYDYGYDNGDGDGESRPVRLHFEDGSTMSADHVIVTVSLGVLKRGTGEDGPGLFHPPLPSFKTQAIARLGFGVVNKLFLQIDPKIKFPNLQMVFHQSGSKLGKNPKIPWWIRRTASLSPIHANSSVVLSWFAGDEALQLESLDDQEIIEGVSATISDFFSKNSHDLCNGDSAESNSNGNGNSAESNNNGVIRVPKFVKVLRSKWGNDPLFLGSYSYVAVGSSGDDLDKMAEPLPMINNDFNNVSSSSSSSISPLQILFAGEATHRTHYSTTHGAYFSGLREANRLLQHYKCTGE